MVEPEMPVAPPPEQDNEPHDTPEPTPVISETTDTDEPIVTS